METIKIASDESLNLTMESEPGNFILPENQITIEIESRLASVNFGLENWSNNSSGPDSGKDLGTKNSAQLFAQEVKSFEFIPCPPYLSTCYDEFSRKFISIQTGKNLPSKIDLVKYNTDNNESTVPSNIQGIAIASAEQINNDHDQPLNQISQNILQHYNPSYTNWFSSFNKCPPDSKHILGSRQAGDMNIIIRLNHCVLKNQFEPVFGTFSVYSIINDEFTRISESFSFDATPESVRKQYPLVYEPSSVDPSTSERSSKFQNYSFYVGDGSGSGKFVNTFNIIIPEEFKMKRKDIFIVVHLSKILSSDAEKAIAPYKSSFLPDLQKHREACYRLIKFRQPFGIGIVKIMDELGKIGLTLQTPAINLNFPIFAVRSSMNDAALGQLAKEIFPVEGNSSYNRMEQLDIEMRLSLFDAGKDDQVYDSMVKNRLISESSELPPQFIPSQIQSETSPLIFTNTNTKLDRLGNKVAKVAILQVMPLFLPTMSKDVTRQIKTSVDNTLFLYPLQFERFQHRNLCIKIELLEFKTNVDMLKPAAALLKSHVVLPSLYNTFFASEPSFISEAYTKISYHNRNPSLNDEIKIRLPDVLSNRHCIKFTVLHIHVKPTSGRTSILTSLIRSNNEKVVDQDATVLGIGLLPLMPNWDCLINDAEHVVMVNELTDTKDIAGSDKLAPQSKIRASDSSPGGNSVEGSLPSLRIRTKAMTSLVSTNSFVQSALRCQPIPLGYLPSSIMTEETASLIKINSVATPPKEKKLFESIKDLTNAPTSQVAHHFLVLFRLLIRCMLAGSCVYEENYINPFCHTPARSQAFLTLLNMIGKIYPEPGSQSVPLNDYSYPNDFLNSYVDFLFDEEIPIDSNDLDEGEALNSRGMGLTPRDITTGPSVFLEEQFAINGILMDRVDLTDDLINEESIELVMLDNDNNIRSYSTEGVEVGIAYQENEIIQDANRMDGSLLARIDTADNEMLAKYQISNEGEEYTDDERFVTRSPEIAHADDSENFVISDHSFGIAPLELAQSMDQNDDYAHDEGREYHSDTSSDAGQLHASVNDISIDRSVSYEALMPKSLDQNGRCSIASESPDISCVDSVQSTIAGNMEGSEDNNLAQDLDEYAVSPSIMGDISDIYPKSADRRSWGKYITNALWNAEATTQKSVEDVAIGKSSNNMATYLDNITNHMVLQAERLVVESIVNSLIDTAISDVNSNPQHPFILPGKRFRPISKNIMSQLPFDDEKEWFSSVDNGNLIEENEVTVVTMLPDLAIEIIPDTCSFSTAVTVNDKVTHVQNSKVNSRDPQILIQPILPMYDKIDGFLDRFSKIVDGNFYSHWWPWLYEVIVYQWSAILAMILAYGGLISTKHIDNLTKTYPIEIPKHQMRGQYVKGSSQDTRYLLMEHGPILLKIIFKSLTLRILREKKEPPVILDDQFLNALENLIMLLTVEIATFNSGLWPSKKLNGALAGFIKSLYSIVAASQVLRLYNVYFKALRGRVKVEESELRLQTLEDVSLFDYIVAINFPYTLDAPLSYFKFELCDPIKTLQLNIPYNVSGIRNGVTPAPNSIAHMMIAEAMASYRQGEKKVKDSVLEILRDMLVRHSYDARYQSAEFRRRVACIYLPLMTEILEEKNRFTKLPYNDTERKELLIILLYILQNVPEFILRERVRHMSRPIDFIPSPSENDVLENEISSDEIGPSRGITRMHDSKIISFRSHFSLPPYSQPIATQSTSFFMDINMFNTLPVGKLLFTLHSILDTFECPQPYSTSAFPVVTSKVNRYSFTGTPAQISLMTSNFSSPIKSTVDSCQVLSPSISIDSESSENLVSVMSAKSNRANTSRELNSKSALPPTRLTKDSSTSSVVSSDHKRRASTGLAILDQMHTRRINPYVSYNSKKVLEPSLNITSMEKGNEKNAENINNANQVTDQRKWYKHMKASEQLVYDKSMATHVLSRSVIDGAAKDICYSTTLIVLDVLLVIIEESPNLFCDFISQSIANNNSNKKVNTAHTEVRTLRRECNLDDSILTGIKDVNVIELVKMCLTIVLHGLHCNQESHAVTKLYGLAMLIIRRFGGKIFLVSVEDSLQDWMRITFTYCSSYESSLRETACNFLLFLFRATFHYLGSMTLLSNTIYAVLDDVMQDILDMYITYADDDKLFEGLEISVSSMRNAAFDKLNTPEEFSTRKIRQSSALYFSIIKLMDDLTVLLHAYSDLRKYVHNPVGYDFFGANLLDGPFDDRTFALSLRLNQMRKVGNKSVNPNDASSPQVMLQTSQLKTTFQIEEVMARFVQASEIYDPVKLPRFRMRWLGNLVRLQESKNNKVEAAEIRWRIFLLCKLVEESWAQQWVPRPPLDWKKQGMSYSENSDYGNSNTMNTPVTGNTAGGGRKSDFNDDRNFFQTLISALDMPMLRPWSDNKQYTIHMSTTLIIIMESYCRWNLIHLAQRTLSNFNQLHRYTKKPELVAIEYEKIANAMKSTANKGITPSVAIGVFYRVYLDGKNLPAYLREKEFIYRNASHLHISEFHNLIHSYLKSVVGEGVETKMITDIQSDRNLSDGKTIYIAINAVKPLVSSITHHRSNNSILRKNRLKNKSNNNNSNNNEIIPLIESLNQVSSFQYSIPFTKDGLKPHAKKIDEQWMRVTTLHVSEPFPFILTRQEVIKREVTIYSPIEVATNDIEDRIEAMDKELEKDTRPSDCNNLMRIIQGTVLPQVNAGAAEVAKVFLDPNRKISNLVNQLSGEHEDKSGIMMDSQSSKANYESLLAEEKKFNDLIYQLKLTLIDFLHISKLLLIKSRKVLLSDVSSSESSLNENTRDGRMSTGGGISPVMGDNDMIGNNNNLHNNNSNNNNNGMITAIDPTNTNLKWQTEMQRGFDALVQVIHPFIKDMKEAEFLLN
eukprot:gene7484-10199_t